MPGWSWGFSIIGGGKSVPTWEEELVDTFALDELWTASTNVVLSGSDVTDWVGVNGNVLSEAGAPPSLVTEDPDFGGNNSLQFTGGEYLVFPAGIVSAISGISQFSYVCCVALSGLSWVFQDGGSATFRAYYNGSGTLFWDVADGSIATSVIVSPSASDRVCMTFDGGQSQPARNKIYFNEANVTNSVGTPLTVTTSPSQLLFSLPAGTGHKIALLGIKYGVIDHAGIGAALQAKGYGP